MSGLPAVRDLRSAIEAQRYEDLSSITDARLLREKMQAAADVAKRAGADELEYRRLARESERALGRLIIAARAAGDLTDRGHAKSDGMSDLPDLGVDYRLASDAVVFAELPEDAWDQAVADGPARTSLASAARSFLDQLQRSREAAEETERRLREEQDRIAAQIEELQNRPPVTPSAPLAPDEVSVAGAGVELAAALPEQPPVPGRDERPEAAQHRNMIKKLDGLAQLMEKHNPVVTLDQESLLDLYSARDAVGRLVNAATVWLRTLNALYEDERTQQ